MSDKKLTVTLDLKRGKVFDEMLENLSDIAELVELLPDYSRPQGENILQRVASRQKAWVSIEAPTGPNNA